MCYLKQMASASFCLVYFSSIPLPCEMNLSRSALWCTQIEIIQLSLDLNAWDEWYSKYIITQGVGTPCFSGMLNTVFLSDLKNKFLVKNLFKPILLVFHFARNVLILQLLFLNCNWWKELTFKFPAGLEDAKRHQYMLFVLLTEWIGDIFCGKLVFQRFSLVPEASCRFKLSVFCSLYATCLA